MDTSRPDEGRQAALLKVGELARRTGLTVRTLHHYDEIGLLRPAARTDAGHRLYGDAEVRRLQQIASLRRVGLSLDDIAGCLDDDGYTLERTLDLHIARIRDEIDEQRRLCALLEALRERAASAHGPDLDELTRTIELTVRLDAYYTPEQRGTMEERAEVVGRERMEAVQREWADLFAAFGDAMDRGLAPDDAEVRALAVKARDLLAEFTGGDPGIEASLRRMYRTESPDRIVAAHGMETAPGLWAYMGEARRALEGAAGEEA